MLKFFTLMNKLKLKENKMLPHERYKKLVEYLSEHGIIKIDKMTEIFDISVETARRDLNYLEKQGIINKIYGGAALIEKEVKEPANAERMSRYIEEKTAIGRKCAEFINDGDSILIEVGTTTLKVAEAIRAKKNLTVITNSIPVANELIDTDFQLYIIGGKIRHDEGSISGAVSMLEMDNFHISKAILSAGGITAEHGLSDYNIEEALIRKKIIEQAKEVILVADSSKFGKDVLAHICPISDINLIITDKGLAHEEIRKFEEKNLKIVFV